MKLPRDRDEARPRASVGGAHWTFAPAAGAPEPTDCNVERPMHRRAISIVTALATLSLSPLASAQSAPVPPPEGSGRWVPPVDVVAPKSVDAPANAFELGVSAGYTQPFGSVRPEHNISDIVGPGFGAGLDLGFRWTPHVSFAWSGQYQESAVNNEPPSGLSARGFAMQLGLTYHALPYDVVDPYLQLGTGVRWLWEVPGSGPTRTTVSAEVLRGQIGLDYRLSRDVAISPYLALDMNVNDTINSYFSAGLMGRFDIGGQRQPHIVARVPGYWEATAPPQPAAAPPPAPAPVEEPKAEEPKPPEEAPKGKARKPTTPSSNP
jgi:hypothetical protein